MKNKTDTLLVQQSNTQLKICIQFILVYRKKRMRNKNIKNNNNNNSNRPIQFYITISIKELRTKYLKRVYDKVAYKKREDLKFYGRQVVVVKSIVYRVEMKMQ